MFETDDESLRVEPERILAATLYLMSCYARDGGSPRLACVVNRHLELLARCPDAGAFVRETCRCLSPAWKAIESAVRKRDAPRPGAFELLREIAH